MAQVNFNLVTNGNGRLRLTSPDYATAHDATDAAQAFQNNGITLHSFSDPTYDINRHFDPFDTSTLPDHCTVVLGAGTFLRLVGDGTAVQDADTETLHIVASNQNDPTNLVLADYDQLGTISFGSMLVSAWNANGNNDIQLNAAGIAAISKTGYTKFGLRFGRDIANTAPTGGNRVIFTIATVALYITYGEGTFLLNMI